MKFFGHAVRVNLAGITLRHKVSVHGVPHRCINWKIVVCVMLATSLLVYVDNIKNLLILIYDSEA